MYTNIRVLVTYQYGYGGPFDRDYPADTPIRTVQADAMKHFKLTPEPATTYHLTADDDPAAEEATIGQVAGEALSIALKLVKS